MVAATTGSRWGRLGVLVLAVGVSGCGLLYPDRTQERRDVLEHYRAIWVEHGIGSYQFVHTEMGNSIRAEAGPVHVTVVDDVIVEVEPLTATGITPTPESYYTVDGLFDRIAQVLDRGPNQFQVIYHPVMGYPELINIDEGGMHGSFTIWIEEFEITVDEEAGG
jgi:hypothetical protein